MYGHSTLVPVGMPTTSTMPVSVYGLKTKPSLFGTGLAVGRSLVATGSGFFSGGVSFSFTRVGGGSEFSDWLFDRLEVAFGLCKEAADSPDLAFTFGLGFTVGWLGGVTVGFGWTGGVFRPL